MIVKCQTCGADVEEHVAVVRTTDGVRRVFCSVRCEEEWEEIEEEENGD
jgi:hypothetical protein